MTINETIGELKILEEDYVLDILTDGQVCGKVSGAIIVPYGAEISSGEEIKVGEFIKILQTGSDDGDVTYEGMELANVVNGDYEEPPYLEFRSEGE